MNDVQLRARRVMNVARSPHDPSAADAARVRARLKARVLGEPLLIESTPAPPARASILGKLALVLGGASAVSWRVSMSLEVLRRPRPRRPPSYPRRSKRRHSPTGAMRWLRNEPRRGRSRWLPPLGTPRRRLLLWERPCLPHSKCLTPRADRRPRAETFPPRAKRAHAVDSTRHHPLEGRARWPASSPGVAASGSAGVGPRTLEGARSRQRQRRAARGADGNAGDRRMSARRRRRVARRSPALHGATRHRRIGIRCARAASELTRLNENCRRTNGNPSQLSRVISLRLLRRMKSWQFAFRAGWVWRHWR